MLQCHTVQLNRRSSDIKLPFPANSGGSTSDLYLSGQTQRASGVGDRRNTCNQLTSTRPAFYSHYLNAHVLLGPV